VCDYPDWSLGEDYQNALKRGFFTLGFGSAMWHGSHTYVGYAFDNRLMAVLAYIAHQGSVQNLPNKSSILQQLSETPRNGTGITVAHDLVEMLADSTPP